MTLTSPTFFATPSLKPLRMTSNYYIITSMEKSHRGVGKPNRKQQLWLVCSSEVCSHVLNFILIGHYKINLSEWNKIFHGRYVKCLPCLHLKKKTKAKTLQFALFRLSRPYSCWLQSHLGSFQYIPVSFRFVPVHSGTFRYHSCPFRRHSASFRYIPAYSGIFRSVPFRSCV